MNLLCWEWIYIDWRYCSSRQGFLYGDPLHIHMYTFSLQSFANNKMFLFFIPQKNKSLILLPMLKNTHGDLEVTCLWCHKGRDCLVFFSVQTRGMSDSANRGLNKLLHGDPFLLANLSCQAAPLDNIWKSSSTFGMLSFLETFVLF